MGWQGQNREGEQQSVQTHETNLTRGGTAAALPEGKWEQICCSVNTLQGRGKSRCG